MSGELEFKTIQDMENYYYGSSAQFLNKADDPVLSTTSNVYQAIYGAKVWVNLNLEANAFGLMPKEPWGKTSGVRVISTRSYSTVPAQPGEDGTLPDTAKPVWSTYTQKPKNVVSTFDTSEIQQYIGAVDDSLGDTMAAVREYFAKEHAEKINKMMLDLAVNYSASNNWPTSLDQIVSGYVESQESSISTKADVFGLDRHSAATNFDAYVNNGSGTNRSFSASILDTTFTNIWTRGGRPKVILTGYDGLQKLKETFIGPVTLGSTDVRRYFPGQESKIAPSVNGIQSVVDGVEGALQVSVYNGVPIVQSKDVGSTSGSNGASGSGTSNFYLFDTDYIGVRVAKPTRYFEAGILSGDPFVVNRLGQKGMYSTLMEDFSRFLRVQAKITHIS